MPAKENLIRKAFDRKKRDFKGFSLRWLAGQLDVSHAYISQILSGKRRLPLKLVDPLCKLLDLEEDAKNSLVRSALAEKGVELFRAPKKAPRSASWELAPNVDFEFLDSWEAVATYNCTLLNGFDGTAAYISRRLGAPLEKINPIILAMEAKGYLKQENGRLMAAHPFVNFQSRKSKEKLRKYHSSVLDRAKRELEGKISPEQVEKRMITSGVVTCSASQIPILRQKISEFLQEFSEEAAAGTPDDLYQIAVQFFPVSKSQTSH